MGKKQVSAKPAKNKGLLNILLTKIGVRRLSRRQTQYLRRIRRGLTYLYDVEKLGNDSCNSTEKCRP